MTDSEGLNPGRDLRNEAYFALIDAVVEAHDVKEQGGIKVVMKVLQSWIGGADQLFAMLGTPPPIRPDEPFLGISDALEELDATQLKPVIMLTILTSCFQVQSRIPYYAKFYAECKVHLEEIRPDEVGAMLRGFEPI